MLKLHINLMHIHSWNHSFVDMEQIEKLVEVFCVDLLHLIITPIHILTPYIMSKIV